MSINVDLYCQSTAEHLTQIFTGFSLLRKSKSINLKLIKGNGFQTGIGGKPVVRAVINHKYKLVYDTFDGNKLFQEDLDWCDFYFKRSFIKNKLIEKGLTQKIFPLGLNYSVYADEDILSIQKILWNIQKGLSIDNFLPFIRSNLLLPYFLRTSSGKYTSRVSKFENYPEVIACAKILYFARLWEPSGRKDEKDRIEINRMRGECIRLLKNRFGDRFIGGLYPTPDALANYHDIVLNENEIRKSNYLKYVKSSQICITTRGLLGSNGWKLAEYVAGAKAIVTESLMYEVPGEFLPGKNYLEFTTPQECVEKVQKLLDEPELRYSIMKNNYDYYYAYLRPDILVWNTIQFVLLKNLD